MAGLVPATHVLDLTHAFNGTSSRSPRSNIIPDLVLDVVPYRRQRRRLCTHQVAPVGALTAITKIADEIEHLASGLVGQLFTCSKINSAIVISSSGRCAVHVHAKIEHRRCDASGVPRTCLPLGMHYR